METDLHLILAVAIFAVSIAMLFVEKIDNTMIALTGALLMVVTGVISWEDALAAIDYETLALLLGLMLLVAVAQYSGIFSWLNTQIAKQSRGNPVAVFLLFTALVTLASTFLNNVTVIILIIPLAVALAKNLNLNAKLLVITLALFSNIGGTLTLIGDPPNTLIGVQAGIPFMDFIYNLWIPVLLIPPFVMLYLYILYRPSFRSIRGNLTQIFISSLAVRRIAYSYRQKSMNMYVVLMTVLFIIATIVLFIIQPTIGLSVGVIGLVAGVGLAIAAAKQVKFTKILHHVEWESLLFFAALFIQVGALEHVGFLSIITDTIANFSDNYGVLLLLIIWVIGLSSMIIENIPFVALMIPVIFELQERLAGTVSADDLGLMWWALSLAACLGGNGTPIGSSAGYLAVEIARKNGVPINFSDYAKVGLPVTIITLVISSGYILGRLYLV